MVQIHGNTIQERFLSAVSSLNLRFPGTVIAQKTGYNKGTVSAYLDKKEPSEAFLKTFCQQFGIDFNLIWTGQAGEVKKEVGGSQISEPTPMQILAVLADALKAQAEIMRSIESKMAQESTQAIIDKKLSAVEDKITEALAGIDTIVDQADEILRKFPSQISKEGSEKRSPLLDVDSKRGESALGAHKRGKSDGGRTKDMESA